MKPELIRAYKQIATNRVILLIGEKLCSIIELTRIENQTRVLFAVDRQYVLKKDIPCDGGRISLQ